nr:hypothetical protein CFP56_21865 [Quercus suber]
MTIGPWLLALLYDLILYIFRTVQWELYGRHRGDRRPRAPSLTERPDGHRRHISLPGIDLPEATLGAKATAPGSRQDVACASSRAPSHFPQVSSSTSIPVETRIYGDLCLQVRARFASRANQVRINRSVGRATSTLSRQSIDVTLPGGETTVLPLLSGPAVVISPPLLAWSTDWLTVWLADGCPTMQLELTGQRDAPSVLEAPPSTLAPTPATGPQYRALAGSGHDLGHLLRAGQKSMLLCFRGIVERLWVRPAAPVTPICTALYFR